MNINKKMLQCHYFDYTLTYFNYIYIKDSVKQ